MMALNTIEELVTDIRGGRMVILMDDEDRENEGDLIMAAELVRSEDINFMAKNARGLICLPLTRERAEQLDLPLMVQINKEQHKTKFTVSIDGATGITTGISAADRARTIQLAASRNARPEDLVQPGHIFPLVAQPGGVLSRAGHTEAGCDLARLAGLEPAAVIVEIMNEDGTMARRPELEKFAEVHGLKIGTIADLIHYRTLNEHTVQRVDERDIETRYGTFRLVTYKDSINGATHLAMVAGAPVPEEPTLVRVHFADVFRDLLGAIRPGSQSWPIGSALEQVAATGKGVVVLLDTEQGEDNVVKRLDDFFAPPRAERKSPGQSGAYLTIGTGSQILRDLNIGKMIVMSAEMKFSALSGFDLEVVDYLPFNPESAS
ncbi:bifunctional 3,4-dihydroxy-2-butanone-4-phosphate synthase/GTP cyclohydrolase II [Allohahella marinimesophila]|uniref:3,4-dihydroxy-2-butanone 4-phosphate synthase n=2 Tax=Allohahella marinimesophila TaxID=1054972 RepID=A0ABP7PWA7_9GAMM